MKYIIDDNFLDDSKYLEFIRNNPGKANLKIRAFTASEALPLVGIHVVVRTMVGGDEFVFFDGETDSSGMIRTLSLPTPSLIPDNLEAPSSILYEILAESETMHMNRLYQVRMYDGICVIQNIELLPEWGSN